MSSDCENQQFQQTMVIVPWSRKALITLVGNTEGEKACDDIKISRYVQHPHFRKIKWKCPQTADRNSLTHKDVQTTDNYQPSGKFLDHPQLKYSSRISFV